MVCHDGILVDHVKIVIIVDLPSLATINYLRTTLGNTRYYRKFIIGYAEVTTPMNKFLKNDVKF